MGRKKKGGQNNQEEEEAPARQPVLDLKGKDAPLLASIQDKLQSLVGQSSGYLETLPEPVRMRIEALKTLHQKHTEYEKQFNAEVAELEKKYNALYKPLYERRSVIVSGEAQPTAEELTNFKAAEVKSEKTEKPEDIKGIPEFWLSCLKHHPDFGEMITERDEEVLKHLTDIKIATVPEQPHSFTIEFYFSDNSFFDEKLLKKTYVLKEHEDGEVMYDHVDASEIKWKPGKNLTIKKVTKTQKPAKGGRRGGRGGGGKPQTITVEQPCESFFNFFNPEQQFEMLTGMLEEDEEDEDAGADFQDFLETDYEIGMELKDKIVPHAVAWYTGEAAMMLDPYDLEDDDDEDNFDEEEEDDDEEEAAAPTNAAPADQSQQQQPECKQQ